MKRTFLLIYTTVSGTTYKNLKRSKMVQTMTHAYSVLLMNLMNWPIYF